MSNKQPKLEEIEIEVQLDGTIEINGWCKVLRDIDEESCTGDCENCYCG
jgi:hypothetical protein